MKFRSKPVVIEAFQWFGDNPEEADAFFGDTGARHHYYCSSGNLIIRTLEGHMTANVFDWVIKGTIGEFYPCKDVVFKAKYEPVEG